MDGTVHYDTDLEEQLLHICVPPDRFQFSQREVDFDKCRIDGIKAFPNFFTAIAHTYERDGHQELVQSGQSSWLIRSVTGIHELHSDLFSLRKHHSPCQPR